MLEGEEKAFSEYNTYTQSFNFTSEKNIYSVSLFFNNTDGGDGGNPDENPDNPPADIQTGEILFRISGSEGGHVFYSFEENSESWTEIHDKEVLQTDALADKTSVYVKYSLEGDYKLDDYIDDTDNLSVNRVYENDRPIALSFTQKIASFSYDPTKKYTVQIRFMNSSPIPPTETGDKDVDVRVTYWTYEQLSEYELDDDGNKIQDTDENGNPIYDPTTHEPVYKQHPKVDGNGRPVFGYVKIERPFDSVLIQNMRVNNTQSGTHESGTVTYQKAGYKSDSDQKNTLSLDMFLGAKADAIYLIKENDNGEYAKINGSDFTNNEDSWYNDQLAPAKSYDVAIVQGESDVFTIIWTTDYDTADKWLDKESGGHFNEDMYLNHGQADVVSVTRNGNVIHDSNNPDKDIVNIDNDFGHIILKKGDDIVLKLTPDYGYQLKSASINGNKLSAIDDNVSTFEIKNIQNNIHFSGLFEKVDNTSTDNLTFSVPETISNVVSSGTLNMEAT